MGINSIYELFAVAGLPAEQSITFAVSSTAFACRSLPAIKPALTTVRQTQENSKCKKNW
ncbi:hypothetical protein ACLMOX_10960 [Prevotella histicola]